jgi:hypothetical protein
MFEVSPLIGGGFWVKGTDVTGTSGETLLRSEPWEALQDYLQLQAAEEVFSFEVATIFAPITKVAEELKAAKSKDTQWSVVVIEAGQEGQDQVEVELDPPGTLLRLLKETNGDCLRWVGNELIALQQ